MHRTGRLLQHLPLILLLLAPACLFASSDNTQDLDSSFADAKGGKGGGNGGNGNGNGGNGGKGGGGNKPSALSVAIQPDTWNTNYEHSEGTVSIVIRGSGLDQIDTGSIVLTGSDEGAEGLTPVRVQANRTQIRAFFAKSDAIALLDSPERGEVHELTVELTVGEGEDEETRSLTVDVRIVGPGSGDDDDGDGEEDELQAEIQPGTWNTNWARSAGTVSVKITGANLGDVDLGSIVMVGTDGEAEPLPALRAKKSGNHIRAFFSKREAIKLLDTPTAGEAHDVIIRLTLTGGATEELELTDIVRVVGPGN